MLRLLFLTSCLTIMIAVADRCEVISVPMCKDLRYNMTKLPNLLGHNRQDDAGLEVHQFFPLVKVQCSQDLREFLCAIYVPRCDPENRNGRVRTPVRQLCESSRTGCQPLMEKFGFSWPDSLNCDKFQDDITATTQLPETTTSYITTTTQLPETTTSYITTTIKLPETTTTSYITTTIKLPETTTSSVNRMIFPCTVYVCFFTFFYSIQYL